MKIERYLKERACRVEAGLDKILPAKKTYPPVVHDAMRYSVLNEGKRIRPILTLASAEACSGSVKKALLPACAIELFHSYSLIHDDLPCLDDDDYRRGMPTCHKRFGEAYALLAGDALLTLGFQALGMIPDQTLSARLTREIAQAIGTLGMIGGQVVDKESERKEADLATLDYINVNKTGKLIRVSCLAGAIIARASRSEEKALARYGEYLGLAFQIVDDIIDSNGYRKLMTEAEARQKAEELTGHAEEAIQVFGRKARRLKELARVILMRKK